MKKHLVILPTYNEAENILILLKQLSELRAKQCLPFDVLIVDDGSSDDTPSLVKDFSINNSFTHIVERTRKSGLGSAYKLAFEYAKGKGYHSATQMDADLSHPVNALIDHLKWISEFDVVVGSRYIPGGGIVHWNIWRRFLSRGGNIFARWVLGTPIHDLTGGFNTWRLHALESIPDQAFETFGYSFQIALKYFAHQKGFSSKEFPFIFVDRERGVSKMPSGQALSALWQVARWRLSSR